MTEQTKSTCSNFAKFLAGGSIGVIVSVFAFGATFGAERSLFLDTAERVPSIENRVSRIELQMAEDRIVSRHMLDLLNEVRRDVKTIRERGER